MNIPNIPERLRDLAEQMMSLGADMQQSDSPEICRHGREMYGAGAIAEGWADGIDEDCNGQK